MLHVWGTENEPLTFVNIKKPLVMDLFAYMWKMDQSSLITWSDFFFFFASLSLTNQVPQQQKICWLQQSRRDKLLTILL